MSTLKVDNIRHNNATSDAITMASDGTCTVKITSVAGAQLSNRRINVNGAMTIAQKGTSVSGNANNGYPLVTDMVNYRRTGAWSGTTWTVSNNTQTPTTLSPFTNFTRWTQAGTVQSAPNDTSTKLQYKIEGQDMAHAMWGTSSAKSCTLSFYVRSSQPGTYCIWCASSDTNYNYIIEYTISAANTWQRITHTFTGPTSGTFNTDNTAGIIFYFIIAGHAASSTYGGATKNVWNTSGRWTSNQSTAVSANAGATWDITGIQFEVGDTATSFEYRNHAEELRRCKRYYQTADYSTLMGSLAGAVGTPKILFEVEMRATPTSVTTEYGGNGNGTFRNQNNGSILTGHTTFNYYINGFDCRGGNGSANIIYASTYKASAEL
tara:strand:+ start:1146 stop:2279 length:1134 start_codon:yes stop_codon:yes gene_type:complete